MKEKTKVTKELLPSVSTPFYVLVVADGHGDIPSIIGKFMDGVGKIDAIFYLGDLESEDFQAIRNHSNIKNAKHLGIVGNHDDVGDLEKNGVVDLHGKVGEVCGLKIAGIRGTYKFVEQDGVMMTDEESECVARETPCCDLLLTHDWGKHENARKAAYEGMAGISSYIELHSPAYHFHGHIHENSEELVGSTVSFSFYKLAYLKISKNGVEILKKFEKTGE